MPLPEVAGRTWTPIKDATVELQRIAFSKTSDSMWSNLIMKDVTVEIGKNVL